MADYNSIHTGSAIDAAITKVEGIEAGADVTDTANVTAAGALMDSEVASLSGVKTLTVPDSTTISAFGATLVDDADAATARTTLGLGSAATTASTDYATAAQGTLADSAQQPPAEGAFVDGDKVKLDGIEAGADVTDTANVTAALSGNTLSALTITTADINGGTIDGTTIGGVSAAAGTFSSATVNGNITVTGMVDGRDVAADGTKLDGIEAGADVTDTANVTSAGALMDSELTDIAAVKALDQGVATTDDPTFTGVDLAAIAASKAVTAVDVFVYNTSKDSDGGAWRKRTQHTSWYNETLNTATRGARREFPAVAVIVATTSGLTIYDGDDPSLPMWMVFNNGRLLDNVNGGISMLNGELAVGTSATYGSLRRVSFVSDTARSHRAIGSGNGTQGLYNGTISTRNDISVFYNDDSSFAARIVNETVNDVAMTVLPDAPIDPATGLQVPTIAVATAGGVSVIKDDGTVVDIYPTISPEHWRVEFIGEKLMMQGAYLDYSPWVVSIPDADVTGWAYNMFPTGITSEEYSSTGSNDPSGADLRFLGATGQLIKPMAASGNARYLCTASGLSIIAANPNAPETGMVAYTTSTYNTGWMPGDIKGAFLADTDDADLVGGTDADRSVNGNDLTVNGTVTRTAVATGAELVAYSGFSASNYLEQAYNSALDFGTGDFCVMGWFKHSDSDSNEIFRRADAAFAGPYFRLYQSSTNVVARTSGRILTSTLAVNSGTWRQAAVARRNGVLELWIDGSLNISGADTSDLTNTSATFCLGNRQGGADAYANGSLALWRISATAPTADQIKKIYEDEKVLFQENAACTLYGASDAVTALAHDSDTGLLHVGTSAGRSVFQGLRRVSNTAVAVGTAISASNGLVVEE